MTLDDGGLRRDKLGCVVLLVFNGVFLSMVKVEYAAIPKTIHTDCILPTKQTLSSLAMAVRWRWGNTTHHPLQHYHPLQFVRSFEFVFVKFVV